MAKKRLAQTRSLGKNNPELRVNLKDIFKKTIPDDSALREEIGQAILDRIVKRTSEGKDRNNKEFRGYSKEYIKSDEFKSFGKSKGKVNLQLTGDMLGLMDIKETSQNTITIGWDDSDEAAKAHGHITGSKSGPKVKRDFFGLTKDDIAIIRDKFKDDIDG